MGINKQCIFITAESVKNLSCFGLLEVMDSDSIAIEPLHRFSFSLILQTVYRSQGCKFKFSS